ncbi:NUDIX hydrolase [Azospirillum ramasamyi]|uniref:NUDIX hydrolase n=1 Tax=Azospirillum ramasamyi TaxID=682998 RepID=A0A2U9SB04_9PROT|nr:NUDIX domain-containing protein [Azospirillum ramasamyi]AWU95766.1 NUDIX hydrolase [Azospirillum ramasamyi]
MSDTAPRTPVPPHPAATLILLRDGPDGLELLAIERHSGLRFAPGATVFPGGRLEAADHDPSWRGRWTGPKAPADLAHRVAAVRECVEECGILLSRDPVRAAALAGLRQAMAAGQGFGAALAPAGLAPALERMAPLARWVTPENLPRRFDTLFFLAPAPSGQEPLCDGGEAVGALWATPRRLLEEEKAGRRRLVFATRMTLRRLAGCPDTAAAMDGAAACPTAIAGGGERLPAPILPRLVETAAGPVWRIPAGCGFLPLETSAEDVRLG